MLPYILASTVQFKGSPNIRQVLIAGMLIMLVAPIGVLADDTLAVNPSTLTLNASESRSVSYSITQVPSGGSSTDCDVNNSYQAKITPNVPTGITASPISVNISGCGTDSDNPKSITFIASSSIATGSYPVDANIFGGKPERVITTDTVTINVPATLSDTTAPVITMLGSSPIDVTQGTVYTDAGATALDQPGDVDLTSSIVVTGLPINTAVLGTNQVKYDVTDAVGNPAVQVVRTVNVIAQVLSLTAPADITINATGVSTTVNLGTPIVSGNTTPVTHDPTGNAFPIGVTVVTWTATNGSATVTDTQIVTIIDPPPVITITGSNPASITIGSTYTDAGATATDVPDGVITSKIVKTSNVNNLATGTYYVNYTVTDNASNAVMKSRTVSVIALTGKAKVIIAFDDGLKSTYTTAKPILDSNGQKAVSFVYLETIIGATIGGGYTDFMTTSDLQTLDAAGWDISSHSYTHCCVNDINYLLNATNAILYHELVESKSWIRGSIPLGRGAMFFAYPWGTYNDLLVTNMLSTGYLASRTVDSYAEYNPSYQGYTVGTVPAMKMTTQMDGPFDSEPYMPLGEMIKVINTAVANNGLLILTFHNIIDEPRALPEGEYDYPTEDFVNVSNYLKQLNLSNNVQVMTMSEYFDIPSTVIPLVPSTPILVNIDMSSRKFANFSWADGAGPVKSDVFDVTVNGVTTYFVTNKYVNVSAQPGQLITVSVTAINQTYGTRTPNVTPLVMSATIPSYMPSTPINIMATMGSNWIKTNWTADDSLIKTDMFNVNVIGLTSRWTNETTNTSVNTTGLSQGQSVTVKVYALNGTKGATTVNTAPVVLTTTLPVTDMPVILSATSDKENFKMNWTYKAGLNTNDVEITTVKKFENGTQDTIVETVPLITNETGEKVLTNLPPHVVVNFSIRGHNQMTGLYSGSAKSNLTMENNEVVLSNINEEYSVTPGTVFKITPTTADKDNDIIVFTKGDTNPVNDTSVNSTTGEYIFDTVNASLGRYNVSIRADDGHGSIATVNFKVLIVVSPPPQTHYSGGSSSSSGGGASVGSDEDFSNIVKFEKKDGYIQLGKEVVLRYTTLNPGIYEIILSGQSEELSVRIENLKVHQKVATDVSGKALLYTNVMISSARVTGFSFNFMLNKSDVTNADNVKAYVWNNNTWKQLDTKVLSSDANSIYFHVISTPAKMSKFGISETDGAVEAVSLSGPIMSTLMEEDKEDNVAVNKSESKKNMPGFECVLVIVILAILYLGRKQ